jgi:hypothetical protein
MESCGFFTTTWETVLWDVPYGSFYEFLIDYK